MKLLPNINQMSLRWVIVGLCLFYLANLVGAFRVISTNWLFGVVALCFWLPLSIGLWLMFKPARLVALVVQWALLFLIPLGVLSPYAEMDHAFGKTPPPIWILLFVVLALGTMNCLAIFYLTKFKDQFRSIRRLSA